MRKLTKEEWWKIYGDSKQKLCFNCKKYVQFKLNETENNWIKECPVCGFKKIKKKIHFALWWEGNKLFHQIDDKIKQQAGIV